MAAAGVGVGFGGGAAVCNVATVVQAAWRSSCNDGGGGQASVRVHSLVNLLGGNRWREDRVDDIWLVMDSFITRAIRAARRKSCDFCG